MGGETERQISGWTVDTLKLHLEGIIKAGDERYEQRFKGQEQAVKDALAAQEKAVNAALVAAEKAVLVAETNASEWRKGANEWRQAMTDREVKFVGTNEFSLLKERIDRAEGGGKGMKDLWGWIIAGVMAIIAAIGAFAKFK